MNFEHIRDEKVVEMITLGELRAHLQHVNRLLPVRFEDGTAPGDFASYRGYYQYPALNHGEDCTAGELLDKTCNAINNTFTGYKGGEFTMTAHSPIWVSGYGQASGLGLVGVQVESDCVHLRVAKVDD